MEEVIANRNTGHTFRDYFKRAVNPMLSLLLLSQRSMYVYEMARQLAVCDYSVSMLYQVLERLEKQGYVIRGIRIHSDQNRVRQYYSITPSGIEHLQYLKQEYNRLTAIIDCVLTNSEKSPPV